jgi:hypothetical protein
MSISSTRVAYRIGFSSALNPGTISAYNEMAKLGLQYFKDSKIVNGFIQGYGCAVRKLQEMGKPVQVEYIFENPDHAMLFIQ